MESLTKQFEQRMAAFLRRTRLSPSEFGERAIGDRKFWGQVRRGRSPTLTTADRILAFMAAYDRAQGAGGAGDCSLTETETETGRSRERIAESRGVAEGAAR